ncbi:hypothetical protein NDU88_003287 [Pleurodeles waltl]|uniref:Uncharacterized protein n=1 Tax=Pleurodeles waltl TaxID=8319 RepID=A0AAV7UDV2_PLEWA|nr:hypothetical protein NDU88_003287 [Pleurodeles waltl]
MVTRNISCFKKYHGDHSIHQRSENDRSHEVEDEDLERPGFFLGSELKNSHTGNRDDVRVRELAPMGVPTQVEESPSAEVPVEKDSREAGGTYPPAVQRNGPPVCPVSILFQPRIAARVILTPIETPRAAGVLPRALLELGQNKLKEEYRFPQFHPSIDYLLRVRPAVRISGPRNCCGPFFMIAWRFVLQCGPGVTF